jgi:UTP--glucose-1-phosphate uridylyltransferase
MNLRKVLIPAAGRGTRFLPATKATPKEMMPIIDRPLLQYSVEEAVAAGMDHLVLVTAAGKESMERHFEAAADLENALEAAGKLDYLAEVRKLSELVSVSSVIQEEQKGVGHAVLQARDLVGDEPFGVMFPDDFILAETPVLQQLRGVFDEHGGIVLAVQKVPRERISSYGVIAGEQVGEGVYRVSDLVEKPKMGEEPSDLAIVGRYILDPRIFEILASTDAGVGGEIQLTDALCKGLLDIPCHAVEFEGDRFDCGSKLGFLEATVAVAMRDPNLGPQLAEWLKSQV